MKILRFILLALVLATPAHAEDCIASWYDHNSGTQTASGERFNENAMTCAHRSRAFGTHLKVTDLGSGQSITCRVNDRGPFVKGRCVDLAKGAARALGMEGIAKVRVE